MPVMLVGFTFGHVCPPFPSLWTSPLNPLWSVDFCLPSPVLFPLFLRFPPELKLW